MKYSCCPVCGEKIIVDKDTFSGEAVREYACTKCDWREEESLGTATWKSLSKLIEREEMETEKEDKGKV